MKRWYVLMMLCFLLVGHSILMAQIPNLHERVVTTGLDTPWEILWGPDSMIWVTERKGMISKVDPVSGQKTQLLTINDVTEISESGLMGMVLHPDFPDTPYVYVAYNYQKSLDIELRIVRYEYQTNTLINQFVLIENIEGNGNHNGCRLYITADRKLLVTTGDAQDKNLPQDFNSLSGKLLRMNLDGSVPADNPWPGKYFISTGHRNAQGLVISPDGTIYISEHGPSNDDELSIIYPKRNYGWPDVEGYCDTPSEIAFCNDSNVVEPIMAWTPTLAVCGLDYYGDTLIPEWTHSLLMATLKADRLVHMKLNAAGDSITAINYLYHNTYGRLRDLCISPEGKVYIATSNKDGRANDGFPHQDDDRIIELSKFGVGIPELDANTIRIFPNPSSGQLNIELPYRADWQVKLMDMAGNNLQGFTIENWNRASWLSGGLPDGIYVVQVSNQNTSFSQLVIIVH